MQAQCPDQSLASIASSHAEGHATDQLPYQAAIIAAVVLLLVSFLA